MIHDVLAFTQILPNVCIIWHHLYTSFHLVFLGSSDGEESACSVGDLGWIHGPGRSPGEGSGYPLSILAWRIPWTEEPSRLLNHKELDWVNKHACYFTWKIVFCFFSLHNTIQVLILFFMNCPPYSPIGWFGLYLLPLCLHCSWHRILSKHQ